MDDSYMNKVVKNGVAMLLPTIVIFYFYHEIILQPASYLFAVSGDGIKNYAVPLWMITIESSWTEYSGMNYPFGESFFYTDGYPSFVWIMKLLNPLIRFTPAQVIGFMNSLMIWSFPIAGFMYYRLIFSYTKKFWASLIVGTSIMLLAPQIFRMQGHFSLTHPEALPLVWLLVLNIINGRRHISSLLFLLIANLFYLFSHPYIGLMTSLFSGLVLSIHYLGNKKYLPSLGALILGFLPPIIFQLTVKLTDGHLERPTNVTGFFFYTAEPDDVFIPVFGPIKDWLVDAVGLHQEWEAWSYVGLGTVLILLFFFPVKWLTKSKTNPPIKLNIAFIPALIFLLWSFGMPFKLGWEEGLDLFPLLQQFRAIGRFTWPFFTVSTVWASVVLIQWSYQRKLTNYFWILLAAVTTLESLPYHRFFSEHLQDHSNVFTTERKEKVQSLFPGEYCGIIPIPYYLLGSETYDKGVEYSHVGLTHQIAFQLGLPNYGGQLIRISIPESKKHMASFSAPYYTNEIWSSIPDTDRTKPFLVVVAPNEHISAEEMNLIERSTPLGEYEGLKFYKILPENFLTKQTRTLQNLDSLPKPIFYRDYSKNIEAPSLSGTGGWSIAKEGGTFIHSFHDSMLKSGTTYEATVWLTTDDPRRINRAFYVAVKECNADSSECRLLDIRKAQESQTHFKSYVGVKLRFEYSGNPTHFIRLETYCKSGEDIQVHLDKAIIHETQTPSFVRLNDTFGLYQGSPIMTTKVH